jgi:hypothetical protein
MSNVGWQVSTPLQSSLSSHCALLVHGVAGTQPFIDGMQNCPGGHTLLLFVVWQLIVDSLHASMVQAMPSSGQLMGVPKLQPVDGAGELGLQVSTPLQ